MIQVLQRAFAVLEVLSNEPTSLALLADKTGLHKSTLHNILRTMVALDVVERTEHGIYALGPKLIALAEPTIARSSAVRTDRSPDGAAQSSRRRSFGSWRTMAEPTTTPSRSAHHDSSSSNGPEQRKRWSAP